ncbi:hypothetical protein FB567DRAFT_546091 [Paraphoma chrysanthemicola]|uniref:DUF7730 domain-containing protein n=1 Tax=Paraphoma chrysanthemicola TaxID=798071 RepID=A0A8K0W230_9PLEO|nr:hypothetical protein FB567DRAFT_546091 [Paraphoma chrysanthemicola]
MNSTSTSHNHTMPNKMANAIRTTNQISSPLLRLPPELRNRIWRFAVGGYIIKIKQSDNYIKRLRDVRMTTKDLTFQLAVAFVPTGSSLAVGNMAFGTRRRPIDLTSTEHECKARMTDHEQGVQCETSHMSVAGLFTIGQTCRQIHAETAFLQYHFNTFYFDHKDSMMCFAVALTSEQKDAIVTIALGPKGKFITWLLFGASHVSSASRFPYLLIV